MDFTTKKGRRVVVTGGSVISALGNDWETVLKNLKAKKNFVEIMERSKIYLWLMILIFIIMQTHPI